ncbi:coat protein [Banana mild mosaic virus]|uniref:Capsid protein n=1 Tax=Banana mild mosaic virus TaxID=148879 RepID=Q993S3_9VIRU|nr:coat protein [Banmivirus BanMMV]AAK28493.1 coat protein [Banmivirus BanMMV]
MATDEKKETMTNSSFDAFAHKLSKRLEKKEYDSSNMVTQPTLEQMAKFDFKNVCLDIATKAELEWISESWNMRLNLPKEKNFETALEIAEVCRHNGSSSDITFRGRSRSGIEYSSLVAAIREICPLRQFCRAYANLVWEKSLAEKNPPQHWQKRGFKERVKYAAFDFLDAVGSDAAIMPPTGISRLPTDEELNANLAAKNIAVINSARKKGNNTVQNLEVTGGRSGVKPEIMSLKLNN